MPTIEIVSIGCEVVPALPDYAHFDYEAESEVKSHRGLFYEFYEGVRGVIVHLFDKDSLVHCSAGSIVEWNPEGFIVIPEINEELGEEQWNGEDQDEALFFRSEVVPELRQLMRVLLHSSPSEEIYFSTDYQFGPGEAWQKPGYSLGSFWEEHDASGLRFNCLYHIVGE